MVRMEVVAARKGVGQHYGERRLHEQDGELQKVLNKKKTRAKAQGPALPAEDASTTGKGLFSSLFGGLLSA